MTVSSSTSRSGPYVGAGTVGPFVIDFRFIADSHLEVIKTEIATGIETTLALTTDYSAVGAGSDTGGALTLVSALSSAYTLTIQLDVPITQELDYLQSDAFPAQSHEDGLDKLTQIAQILNRALGRTIRAPESAAVFSELPDKASRALHTLGFDADGNPTVLTPAAGSAAAVLTDLADSSNASKGDALVSVKRTVTGAIATTQHAVNEHRELNAVIDFAAPINGTSTATAAIQSMFDAAAANGVSEIYFPPGTYLLACERNDADYTCAVVISGLKNCRVYGAEGTKFTQDTSGSGPDEYGMFRIEKCEGLTFENFEMDGSGIVSNGTGANRSRGFVLSNLDVNNKATEYTPTNKQITFRQIYAHHMGGFVGTTTRNETTSGILPFHELIQVLNCRTFGIVGQDHAVAVNYVKGITVDNCRFVNDTAVAPMDNMAVDFSAETHNAVARNNYVYGFAFGMKCETHTGGGGGEAVRESERALFENNVLEEIGLTDSLLFGGTATYGFRFDGRDVTCRGNTIRARTIGVTTGGLGMGMVVTNSVGAESHYVIDGNTVHGTGTGINHDAPADSDEKFTCVIRDNKISDCSDRGIICSNGASVERNRIYRSGGPGIELQTPNHTIVRDNLLIDCCSTAVSAPISAKVAVFMNDTGAIGYTEVVGNNIIDTRGGSAAAYAYVLRAFTTYTNAYLFRPGYAVGLGTAIAFDKYVSDLGESMQLDGVTTPGPRVFLVTNNPQSTSPWNGIAWNVGDRAILSPPSAGSTQGWVCTVAGTPGTWIPFGINQVGNAYTVTNPSTDRALNVSADTTAQVAAVLGTLIADLQAAGVLK